MRSPTKTVVEWDGHHRLPYGYLVALLNISEVSQRKQMDDGSHGQPFSECNHFPRMILASFEKGNPAIKFQRGPMKAMIQG